MNIPEKPVAKNFVRFYDLERSLSSSRRKMVETFEENLAVIFVAKSCGANEGERADEGYKHRNRTWKVFLLITIGPRARAQPITFFVLVSNSKCWDFPLERISASFLTINKKILKVLFFRYSKFFRNGKKMCNEWFNICSGQIISVMWRLRIFYVNRLN